jgi:hypothetical protein
VASEPEVLIGWFGRNLEDVVDVGELVLAEFLEL